MIAIIQFLVISFCCMSCYGAEELNLTEDEVNNENNTFSNVLFEIKGYPKVGDIPLLNRKIFRGFRVTVREHPYIASIRRNCAHYLTGTLISKNLILTVAHPIYNVPVYELGVVLGENYSDRGTKILTVVIVIVHKLFNPYTLVGDIAILRLYEDVVYRSFTKSISLLGPRYNLDIGQDAFVTGWGRCDFSGNELCLPRSSKYFPDEIIDPMLRSVRVPLSKNNHYCKGYNLLETPLRTGMICVGKAREEDIVSPCLGVPGAPLVLNGKLVGILSWGFGCGFLHDLPLVYTDLQYYALWLLRNVPVLRNIAQTDLDGLFVTTKSYKLLLMLDKTRLIKTSVHRHPNKELISHRLDELMVRLDGNFYDVRDFIYNTSHHSKKKEIYDLLHMADKSSKTMHEEVATLSLWNSSDKFTADDITNLSLEEPFK